MLNWKQAEEFSAINRNEDVFHTSGLVSHGNKIPPTLWCKSLRTYNKGIKVGFQRYSGFVVVNKYSILTMPTGIASCIPGPECQLSQAGRG